MKNTSSIANRIVFLDYLRVVAFMSVLIGHKFTPQLMGVINNPSTHSTLKAFLTNIIYPLVLGGGAGVCIFFFVSGYIILAVLQMEKPFQFLIKRCFRIYPLYIIATIFYILLSHYDQQVPFPDFKVFIYQILLIGDYMGIDNGLAGVEWTLRLEVSFYIIMYVLTVLKIIPLYQKYLPIAFLFIMLLLYKTNPIPNFGWSIAYFNIYLPFLFCGSLFYLYEIKAIKASTLFLFLLIVFCYYFKMIAKYQSGWLNADFAFFAFIIFAMSWYWRDKFVMTPLVLLLSDLTFAVYLFHNWLYDYFLKLVGDFKYPITASLVLLFLFCYGCVKFIEKPGVKLGRMATKKLNKH